MFGSFGFGGRRGRSFHVLQYMRCCVRHDFRVLFSMLVWYIPDQAGPRHQVSGTGNGVGISIFLPPRVARAFTEVPAFLRDSTYGVAVTSIRLPSRPLLFPG